LSDTEFQTVGAAKEKARLAITVRIRGTASLGAWIDRSRQTSNCRSLYTHQVGERAFSHAGPAAWNSMPEHIRIDVFRKLLKTHLFNLAFKVHWHSGF